MRRIRLQRWLAGMALTLMLCGCGRSGSTSEDKAAAAPVVMTVTGVKAVQMPMREKLNLLGATAALRHITVRSPVAGRVLDLTVQSGDRVTRGQVVARVINREVEAAQNGLAVARALDPAEAAKLAAAVKRNSFGDAIAVAAPDDAIVDQRFVSSGQRVADLDPLLDLVDPRSIYVDAAVPVEDLAQLRIGMPATVTSPLDPRTRYAARVSGIAPSLNAGGATINVRIEFANAQRILQAGAPVNVAVTTAAAPDAIVVPQGALFENAANRSWYVFIAGADGIAHRRTVTLGIHSEQFAQITSGVAAGETVITSGGYALSDGLHVRVTPSR